MEQLSKKTTILFSPELHRRLTEYAARRGVSLGELVREACEATYGVAGTDERVAAVRDLGRLRLPVGRPADMKRESQPDPARLLP
jgi:predicted DNA-binding protein